MARLVLTIPPTTVMYSILLLSFSVMSWGSASRPGAGALRAGPPGMEGNASGPA